MSSPNTQSPENITRFDDLGLLDPIQKTLKSLQYQTPTPIQAQTIPHALEGRDVLGCAQTGTGKTAAFALPILDFLASDPRHAKPNRPQVLVLAPTRELAIQIGDSFKTYGKSLKLRVALVFGGVNQNSQVRELQKGVHILVATPGRLIDLMNQGHIQLGNLEVFVLDEADRMMDMGFLPDLKRVIAQLPKERQSLFFSATMPPKIEELSSQLLFNPVRVNVTPKSRSLKAIQQKIVFCERGEKVDLLKKLLREEGVDRTIVFTRTKRGANAVARRLESSGTEAAIIHGNKSQAARQRALANFRDKKVRVLVATDVAARGIDIDQVTHVVNYDLPNEAEAYVHRIGRTGRAGADGQAVSFCTVDEMEFLRDIEKLIGIEIPSDSSRPAHRRTNGKQSAPAKSGGRRSGPRRSTSGNSSQANRSRSSKPGSRSRKGSNAFASANKGNRNSSGRSRG